MTDERHYVDKLVEDFQRLKGKNALNIKETADLMGKGESFIRQEVSEGRLKASRASKRGSLMFTARRIAEWYAAAERNALG